MNNKTIYEVRSIFLCGYHILSNNVRFIKPLQVDFDDVDVIVTFTILGGAPITGDVMNPATQVNLDAAANLLSAAINKGQFMIPVDTTSLANVRSLCS